MKSTPVFDELQKHWSIMQAKAKLEARVELVNQLKQVKRPVKQVQDLIKEYEKYVKDERAVASGELSTTAGGNE